MKTQRYRITVDCFRIGEIELPPMTIWGKDAERQKIAKEYGVPAHYIRLIPESEKEEKHEA